MVRKNDCVCTQDFCLSDIFFNGYLLAHLLMAGFIFSVIYES